VPAGVALTFDDGPVLGTTNLVLDTLAALGVQATFFCVGRNAARHPALLQRMRAEGHAVGSHSLTHAPLGAQSPAQLVEDFIAGRKAVEDALGADVPLFRPPYGRLHVGTVRLLRSFDTWVMSIDSGDWRPSATAADVDLVLRGVEPGDVVLLHDWLEPVAPHSHDRSATVAALERLVARLRRDGVPLVRLQTDRARRTAATRLCPSRTWTAAAHTRFEM
jgi:peptidoglycan/xylan/chitin deacetylase (PgdA/CDA1 family)